MAAVPVESPGNDHRTSVLPFPEILSETAHLLLQEADPDSFCQAIFNKLRAPFGVDVYFHYLVSADESFLELASSGGAAKVRVPIGSQLSLGSAVCGTVAERCEPVYVSEVQGRTDEMTAFIRGLGVRAYACHPLLVRGHLLGTLSFGSTTRDEFTPEELDLFALVAQQITIATDRREQSQRLRRMERLATAGRMSATLAHEINNPLESLGNLLYMLRDEVHSEAGEKLVHQAEALVTQLAGTVQNTLEMFRGGTQGPHMVNLTDLARDFVAGLTLPNHARLESTVADDLCVVAIPGELRQVLFNLLTNAAHFTPPGASVKLWVRRIGTDAEIRVRDEGRGISDESRPKLFQPFYTTRGKDGTGIGLWLSKEMIERSGGHLVFESNPTVQPGTEFIATLPLAE